MITLIRTSRLSIKKSLSRAAYLGSTAVYVGSLERYIEGLTLVDAPGHVENRLLRLLTTSWSEPSFLAGVCGGLLARHAQVRVRPCVRRPCVSGGRTDVIDSGLSIKKTLCWGSDRPGRCSGPRREPPSWPARLLAKAPSPDRERVLY